MKGPRVGAVAWGNPAHFIPANAKSFDWQPWTFPCCIVLLFMGDRFANDLVQDLGNTVGGLVCIEPTNSSFPKPGNNYGWPLVSLGALFPARRSLISRPDLAESIYHWPRSSSTRSQSTTFSKAAYRVPIVHSPFLVDSICYQWLSYCCQVSITNASIWAEVST